MARRFLLVGLFVVWPFRQGQVMQLGFAALMVVVYLVVQSQAVPYRNPLDNALALSCSFSLCILLICCVFYKYGALLSTPHCIRGAHTSHACRICTWLDLACIA